MKKVLCMLLALALLPCLFTMALADTDAVELELKADDGSVATAVFPGAYTAEGVLNIDGEDRAVTAVIVDDSSSLTVDKAITGTGYLAWEAAPSGLPALEREETPVKTAAGEHVLDAFVDGQPNTDSPFYAYSYYEESWGGDAVMMYDLITYTAADGSTVYVTFAGILNPAPVTGDVELELKADDGSVATAVFPDAYTAEGVLNIDGEDRAVTAVIVDDSSSLTVDKAITGTGYLAWEAAPSGLPALEREETPVKTAAGEHVLDAFVDGQPNTDSPFYAYPFYSEEWGDSIMMYDLITYTAADGSTVYVTFAGILNPQPAPDDPDTPSFPDVPADEWYYDAVDYVVAEGLMKGDNNGKFKPLDTITRAEVAQILYNRADAPGAGSAVFTDVPKSQWYYDAVTWAADQGLVQGSGGAFAPTNTITREQLAVMLYNAADKPDADPTVLNGRPDGGKVSDWARTQMAWAVESGVITGDGNGNLNPKDTATRAEVAIIMQRWCGNFGN